MGARFIIDKSMWMVSTMQWVVKRVRCTSVHNLGQWNRESVHCVLACLVTDKHVIRKAVLGNIGLAGM